MKAGYDCIKAFSETDFTEDLKKFDVPTLVLHGDERYTVASGHVMQLDAIDLRSTRDDSLVGGLSGSI